MTTDEFFGHLAKLKDKVKWTVHHDGGIQCQHGNCPILAVLYDRDPLAYQGLTFHEDEESGAGYYDSYADLNEKYEEAANLLQLDEEFDADLYILAVDTYIGKQYFSPEAMEKVLNYRALTLNLLGLPAEEVA